MSYEQQPAVDDFDDDDDSDSALAFVDRSAHVTQRMRKRKMLKWAIVAVPLALGLIVGLAMKASASKSNSNTTTPVAVGLVNPPADLDAKCNPSAVATPEGKQACRMLCEPAECCDFPANLALSCLAGNEDRCHVYHTHCHATAKGVTDPPADMPVAPKDLSKVCSASAIATIDGFTKCQEHCARASCCFEKDEAVCQVEACDMYAPCLTIGATNFVHDTIPDAVAQQCDADNLVTLEGRSACRTSCSHALCCFTDKGCPHEDTSFCDQYSVCDDLEHNLNAVSSAEEIKAECTSPLNEYTHMALCEVECERGACCFLSQGCGDIFPDNDCTIYEPCAFMYNGQTTTTTTTTTTTPVLKVDVDAACIDFDPAEKNAADAECTKYCKDAQCCFDVAIDCPDTVSCHVLAECKVIYGDSSSSSTITVDATVVLEACDAVEIAKTVAGQPSLCETVCQDGLCCFDEDADCTAQQECAMYNPCKILFGSVPTSTADSAAVAAVKAACVKDGLFLPTDNAGFAACENTCEPGACCFTPEGCSDASLECKAYIPCTYFYSDGNGATPVHGTVSTAAAAMALQPSDYSGEDITAACTSEGSVSSMCENMCKSGACCFDSSMVCPAGSVCKNYASCPGAKRRLDTVEMDRKLGGKNLKDMLTEVCIEDAVADDDNVMGACKALCKKGSCCFAQSNCDVPTGLVCEDYVPCFILYDPTDDDDVVEELEEEADEDFDEATELDVAEEEEEVIQTGYAPIFHDDLTYEKVHTACTDHESIHLPGMPSMCQQYCSQALCCFGEHQECPKDLDCSIYVPCASSTTFESTMAGIAPPTMTAETPPIFSKDTIEKLKVDEACDGSDMSHCVRKCVEAACCYALTEAETCKETSPDFKCNVYSSCDSVYGGRKGDDGEEDNGRRRL
jgi:hypothetical protein